MASDYFSKMSYLPREVVEAGRVLAEHFTARRGRSVTPALAYACVYAASKISGVPIRLSRLEAMSGVKKRAIVRAHRELVDALGLVEPPVNPKAYVKHYCEIFHLPPEVEARTCACPDKGFIFSEGSVREGGVVHPLFGFLPVFCLSLAFHGKLLPFCMHVKLFSQNQKKRATICV